MRYASLRRDAALPLILIAVGVVALLANAGVLSRQALVNLGFLWPLVLVVVGLVFILRAVLPGPAAAGAGLAVAAIIVAAALIVAVAGPPIVPLGTTSFDTAAALGSAPTASLAIDVGASSLTVGDQDLGRDAYRAHVVYAKADGAPSVRFSNSGNALTIRSGTSREIPFFQPEVGRIDLTLSNRVPWSVDVQGGAANLRLSLSDLRISRLGVGGGASDVQAALGTPRGTVPIDVSGGASSVAIHLPSGSQWRLRVSGGASSVSIDGRDLSEGDQVTQSSSGFDGATDRYDIEVSGGASDVSIDTTGSTS